MQRYLKIAIMSMAVVLAGCATTDQRADTANHMSMLQSAIKHKCHSELTSHQYWKIASLAMTKQAQDKVSHEVCSCIGEKTPQTISLTEAASAAINADKRNQVVRKAVLGSLQACMADYLK